MTQEEIDEQKYIKGYNAGYIISQYETELFRQLEHAEAKSPYIDGLKAGKTASIKEQVRSNFLAPDWLKGDKFIENDKDITKDPSRDKGIEPEI